MRLLSSTAIVSALATAMIASSASAEPQSWCASAPDAPAAPPCPPIAKHCPPAPPSKAQCYRDLTISFSGTVQPGEVFLPRPGVSSQMNDRTFRGTNLGLSDLRLTVIDLATGRPAPEIQVNRKPRSTYSDPLDCPPIQCVRVIITVRRGGAVPGDYAVRISTPGGEQSQDWRFRLAEQPPPTPIPRCIPQVGGPPQPNRRC